MKDKLCVNGCNEPVCPPSRVICKKCMDKITKTLEDMISKLEARRAELNEEMP